MRDKRVILIDGMSGIGKSTLAQRMYICLADEIRSVEWFHEEESNHPIYCEQYEDLLARFSFAEYHQTILSNWMSFLERRSPRVAVLESQISLVYVASLLWYDAPADAIQRYTRETLSLLREHVSRVIFLRSEEPKSVIENTCRRRGEAWRTWYFEYFATSRYAKKQNTSGADGLGMYWSEVEQLMSDAFIAEKMTFDQYYLASMDFGSRNEAILRDSIDNYRGPRPPIREQDAARYCGDFTEADGTRTCHVYLKGGALRCDFGWPDLELIQKRERDEFYIGSFPHQLKYLDADTIEITGKDIACLRGKVFVRRRMHNISVKQTRPTRR